MSFEARDELIALFHRASALPRAERAALLAELGREKPGLARELDELLAQDERGGPLPSAASGKRSLVESLVEELAHEGAQDAPSSAVLEKLAARSPSASRYSIQGEFARGGMGAILEVWDEDIGRSLAMKVVLETTRTGHGGAPPRVDARTLARFLEEAQVTGQLDHPGIVPVHELGLDPEGRAYFTMRLVKGRDLEEIFALVRRGEESWNQTRALGVLLKVCEAMSYAHSNGVVHRDLKPANVMIGRFGEVYVMDWGLARARGRRLARERQMEAGSGSRAGSAGLLATADGAILGTPAYMPPEQAAGRLEEVDERSDVYAVGAMLYQLLAGRQPYCDPDEHLAPPAVIARVLAGPPAPIHASAPAAPAELVAIAEKAMARVPRERYRDVGELGADLQAFLEGRVVRAFEAGAWAEARKWVRRNRGFAAAVAAGLVALLAGLTMSLILRAQSEDRRRLAVANEARADREADLAKRRADEVLRLSALQRLDDLVAEADRLWPAHPENLERYREWIRKADELVGELPDHERTLEELRARALPVTATDLARHRAESPKLRELEWTKRQRDHLERMRAALGSSGPPEEPVLADVGVDPSTLPGTAGEVAALAWALVDPDRADWGGEAKGLALARRAMELAAELPAAERAPVRTTLAWALFANGRLDEAVSEEMAALEEAAPEAKTRHEGGLERLQRRVDEALDPAGDPKREQRLAALAQRISELEVELAQPPERRFDDAQDKWWFNQLEKLVLGLRAFSDPETGLASDGTSEEHGWGMRRRAEFALTIAERSVSGAEAARLWASARASIADAKECPSYGELRLGPQLGLLPIGRDPASGLWEFVHLQTGDAPVRDADGKLVLTEQTGLVLVLVPGGRFRMGAQRTVPGGENYDPFAEDSESPLHDVTLAPYFISKYEMTQGQWLRFTGKNPSSYDPRTGYGGKQTTLLHPVEHVSWTACADLLARLGLSLPTEAQWEYAARAGTTTPWWTGRSRDSVGGAANLADAFCRRSGGPPSWSYEDWDDGYAVHAPVGSYAANAFGLHDVLGNVWEWCRDWRYDYDNPVAPGDGERVSSGSPHRVTRGGGFDNDATGARSADRDGDTPEVADRVLGLRPAMAITL